MVMFPCPIMCHQAQAPKSPLGTGMVQYHGRGAEFARAVGDTLVAMEPKDSALSRRGVLTGGVALAAQGGALLAQTTTAQTKPAQSKPAAPSRKFRGWVSRGAGPGRTTLQELTLRPISGRQIVVRTEATNLCYSNSSDVLGLAPPGLPPAAPKDAAPREVPPAFLAMSRMALVQGHGGVGIVEAVGPEVRRVQAGDRVCVSGTPQCGACYQCLRGRADMCQFL